jgi:hypothetical protein
MKTKARRQREPSEDSLREMPEHDFSKAAKGERGQYYKRIVADGGYWAGPEGSLRWYPMGKGGRPKKDSGVEPSSPHSIRLPDSLWKRLDKEAKKVGVTRHALLRKIIVDGLAEAGSVVKSVQRKRARKVA